MTFPRDMCHCISMCELLLQSPNKVDVSKWGKQPWVERGSPNKADCKDRGSGGAERRSWHPGQSGMQRVDEGIRGILLEVPSGCSIGISFNNSLSPKIFRVDSIIGN